ncbi:hypothetical protein [Ktedonobacter robiniae]|uniref:Transposase IS30-like HTH domain-containing protein n=1 Tax=Ktedonobacter robiniae TaxID=2778365 RepID=A0ABQ3UXX9_9CHLR|nr:hypothetical protein [Ktedonobacter robiniae]GHO57716.1 hypothetical protein KSB_61910 [Ktedonobacter robiniae]
MITVQEREAIRRAYYLDRKSKRQIAREQGHSRKTIDKAVANVPPRPYQLTQPKAAPVFGPSRREPTRCLLKTTVCPASSSTQRTRSLKSSR